MSNTLPRSITVVLAEKDIARFWSHVDKSGECWLWTGSAVNRYGMIRMQSKKLKAHRVSWFLHFGQISDGLYVCHRCDVPMCVNPAHLFIGTSLDNHDDMKRKGRAPIGAKNGTITRPDRSPRGARHGNAKLTEADVLDIRRRYQRSGHKSSNALALAAEFGIARNYVLMIVSGRSWRHILAE